MGKMGSAARVGRRMLLGGAAGLGMATAAAAQEQAYAFDIPAQSLSGALNAYGRAAGRQILFTEELVRGRSSPGLRGRYEPNAALDRLLAGTGLAWRRSSSGGVMILRAEPPQSVAAVQADPEPPPLEELVVTGTHIRGGPAISPVVQVTREDLDVRGILDVGQALRQVTANFSGGVNPETNVGGLVTDYAPQNSTHATSANLLGLGSGSTLVLLNGHRLPVVGNGVAVDLSLIPLAAIERMDVLADGASAVYGADAVAGVINLISRRRYEGVETRVRYGGAEGGMETWKGSLLGGAVLGRGAVVLGGEWTTQDRLYTSKRAASRLADQPYTLFGDIERSSIFGSAEYAFSPRVKVLADLVYMDRSERDEIQSSARSRNYTRPERDASQYAASAQLSINPVGDWTADITGLRTRSESRTRTPTFSATTNALTQQTSGRHWHELWSWDLRSSGTLFHGPTGPVEAALGAAYREESSRIRSGTVNAAGTVLSRSDTRPGRDVASVYGELTAPVWSRAQLSVAARYEDYSDFGGVTSPKAAARWDVLPGLSLAASYSESFRAPSPFESSSGYGAFLLDATDTAGRTRILYLQGPGKPLGPEEATNLSLSATWRPPQVSGLEVSAQYYKVEYDDRIANPDPNSAFGTDMRAAPAILVTRNPTQAEVDALVAGAAVTRSFVGPFDPTTVRAIVDVRNTNIAKTRTEGIQASAQYRRDAFGGELQVSASLNYVLEFEDQLTETSAPVQRVDRIFSPPRWRSRTGAQWSGTWGGASAFWNHVDSYTDDRVVAAPVRVDSWDTFDASIFLDLGASVPGKRTRLVLSAQNVTDERPPPVAASFQRFEWDAANASIVGRFVSLELIQQW